MPKFSKRKSNAKKKKKKITRVDTAVLPLAPISPKEKKMKKRKTLSAAIDPVDQSATKFGGSVVQQISPLFGFLFSFLFFSFLFLIVLFPSSPQERSPSLMLTSPLFPFSNRVDVLYFKEILKKKNFRGCKMSSNNIEYRHLGYPPRWGLR